MARFFTIIGVLVALAGCQTHDPMSPTSGAPAATAIVVTGLASTAIVGDTIQLTAWVTLSDGGRKQVEASQVTWQSSDVKVASVGATGLVRIVAAGEVDVTAKFQSLATSTRVIASPLRYDIAGVIHETAPTQAVTLSDVSVDINGGSLNGYRTLTDATGRFKLTGVADAGFTLHVSKAGYDATDFAISSLPRDQHPDIGLNPTLKTVQEIVQGTFAPDCGTAHDYTFALHHDGAITIQSASLGSFEGGIQLFQGNRELFHGCYLCGAVPLQAGYTYRLHVFGDCIYGGSFRIVFSHPN